MGRLTVTILGCRDLEAKDWFGRSDPYVKVSCSGKTYRTKTVDKSLNPNFNEQFTFFIADPDTEQLRLDVYDSDLFKDDKLGTYVLSLSGLTKGKKIEGWYVLQAPAKKGLIGVCLYPEDFGSSETPTNALKAKVPGKRPSPAHVSDSDEEESRSFQEKPPVQKSEVPPPKNPVSTEIPPQPIVAPSVKPQPVVAPAPQEKVATPSPAQVSVQWPTPQVETTQGGNQGNAATSWSATQPHQDICTYNATAGYMCAVQQAPQQNTPVGQQYPFTIPSSNGYNVGGGMQMPSTTPNPYGYYPTPGNTTYPGNTNPWPNVTFPQPPTAVYTSVPTASMNQPGNAYPNMAPYPPQQAALPLSYQNPFGHTY